MTGRWAASDHVSVRSVEAIASGQKMTVEIGRMPLNTGDTWLSSGDRTLRSSVWSTRPERPVNTTGASGRPNFCPVKG